MRTAGTPSNISPAKLARDLPAVSPGSHTCSKRTSLWNFLAIPATYGAICSQRSEKSTGNNIRFRLSIEAPLAKESHSTAQTEVRDGTEASRIRASQPLQSEWIHASRCEIQAPN